MQIVIRANQILISNVSDLLDKAENPAKMLRQMIAELEDALLSASAEKARVTASRDGAVKAQSGRLTQQAGWTEKAKFALSKDRVDLAKRALAEQEKAGEAIVAAKASIAEQNAAIAEAERTIAALHQRLADARVRLKALEVKAAALSVACESGSSKSRSRDAHVMDRFDRMDQKLAFAMERKEFSASDNTASALQSELDKMARSDKIDASLAALVAAAQKPRKSRKRATA